VIRAHQPGSEPIDIPETIPNPVVVPKPTPTPTEPAPKEPVRIPEKVPWGGVLKALSVGDGEFEYRIRNMNEPHERVAREAPRIFDPSRVFAGSLPLFYHSAMA
jgi:hypothetical protein